MGNLGNIQSLNPHGRLGSLTNLQYPFVKKGQTVYNTIYVNTATGNDANTGYKPSAPKATIQNANDSWRIGILYILIAGGTYAEWPVINKNVEFKGSYDSTFTTQDFVATPTILAKAGAGVSGYALTFTADTNNGCVWEKTKTLTNQSGYPTNGLNILGSPIVLFGEYNSGFSSTTIVMINNAGATDSAIFDSNYVVNTSTGSAYTNVGVRCQANAKAIIKNNLISIENYWGAGSQTYVMMVIGGGTVVLENNTLPTDPSGQAFSAMVYIGGEGVTLKNNIMKCNAGAQSYGVCIVGNPTIIAENNCISGATWETNPATQHSWYSTTLGSLNPVGAYIITDPKLDTGANIGRLTPPPQGLPALSNAGGTYHNGYIYVYYAGILYRSADGITFVQFGFGVNLRFATLISFGSELLILGGDNGAGTAFYNSVYSVNIISGLITAKNSGSWAERGSIGAFVLNSRLYITGGNDATVSYNDLWIYDKLADGTGTDSWTDVTPSTPYSGRTQFGIGVINVSGTERVFIFGGTVAGVWAALNSCISWSVGETSWTAEQNLPSARMSLINAPVLNNKIYCCGGASTNWATYYKTVFAIDDSKTWTTVTSNAEFGERIASINVSDGTNLYVVCGTLLDGGVSDAWKSTNAGANWTESYDGTIVAGTPVQVSMGGTDLSAEFTTDKDGITRTIPFSMGCYDSTNVDMSPH